MIIPLLFGSLSAFGRRKSYDAFDAIVASFLVMFTAVGWPFLYALVFELSNESFCFFLRRQQQQIAIMIAIISTPP